MNDCSAETVDVAGREQLLGEGDNFDMVECYEFQPASPNYAQAVAFTYNAAFQWGQNDIETCEPTDEVSHKTAHIDIELDIAKQRREKILRRRIDDNKATDEEEEEEEEEVDDSGIGDSILMDASNLEEDVKYEWEQNYVKEEWIQAMREHQANKLPVDKIQNDERINHWFEYLPMPDQKKSRYRCRICHKYANEFLIHEHYLTNLAKDEGVLHDLSFQNSKEISKHHTKSTHKHILLELKKREQDRVANEIAGIIGDKYKWKKTNRHMRLVYSGNLNAYKYKIGFEFD